MAANPSNPRVLCVNANAAIDKTVIVPGFKLGQIFRPQQVIALPGGKGINVARGLQTLGLAPVVTGWAGGFAGQFIASGLVKEGIGADFIPCDFESRTCLSILDPDANTLTELYEKGDLVPAERIEALIRRFQEIIGDYTAVTLSGSLPPGVPPDFYSQLVGIARSAGVLALLDASGEALRQGLARGPALIKPNETEFEELVGRNLEGIDDFATAAQETARRYNVRVVLSLGERGALAADPGEVVHIQPPKLTIRSAVGSGDCLVAGLTYGLVNGFSFEQSLRYGVAAGTANALTVGAGKFTYADFERVLAGCQRLR